MEKCGVYKALKILGNKWTLLILRQLCTKPKGFNELQRNIDLISPKVLSERLKELVDAGLVHKEIFPTTPPRVEYTLTQKGADLRPIIDALQEWGSELNLQKEHEHVQIA